LKRKREQAELAQDPKLKEFLQIYQPPSKTNVWTNGDIQPDVPVVLNDEPVPTVDAPDNESDDDYQVIAKKPKTAIETPKAASLDTTTTPIVEQSALGDVEDKSTQHGDAMDVVEDDAEANRGPVSDIDWLRSRTNRVLDLVEDDEQPAHTVTLPESKPARPAQSTQPAQHIAPEAIAQPDEAEEPEPNPEDVPPSAEVDKIRDTGRLYLRNLHFDVTEEELREHFSKYGSLEEVSYFLFLLFVFFCAMMNV
jgi:multiple RNA-binding domain-containing protein 1